MSSLCTSCSCIPTVCSRNLAAQRIAPLARLTKCCALGYLHVQTPRVTRHGDDVCVRELKSVLFHYAVGSV